MDTEIHSNILSNSKQKYFLKQANTK